VTWPDGIASRRLPHFDRNGAPIRYIGAFSARPLHAECKSAPSLQLCRSSTKTRPRQAGGGGAAPKFLSSPAVCAPFLPKASPHMPRWRAMTQRKGQRGCRTTPTISQAPPLTGKKSPGLQSPPIAGTYRCKATEPRTAQTHAAVSSLVKRSRSNDLAIDLSISIADSVWATRPPTGTKAQLKMARRAHPHFASNLVNASGSAAGRLSNQSPAAFTPVMVGAVGLRCAFIGGRGLGLG